MPRCKFATMERSHLQIVACEGEVGPGSWPYFVKSICKCQSFHCGVSTMYLNTTPGILFGSLFVLFINLLLNLLVFDRLKSATSEDVQRKLGTCPMVSILVPARNEADHIEECVRSLIEQRYE